MNAIENNVMTVKQTLTCGLHSPEKWQEDYNGCDKDAGELPNYAPVKVYTVDEYPACPDNWEHGSDIAGSYFTGLDEDGALWIDFNDCFDHTHDVAVVLSVQGINPITGQTMIGDNPLRMEQYHTTCPIHGTEFKQDYFCEDCGFSWPGQNYLSTTGTPFQLLWLDGFRTPDGNVRQYIITAEKMRGIAAQVMENSEERVFAIGVAFYLSKNKKPEMPKETEPRKTHQYGGGPVHSQNFFSPMHTSQSWSLGGNISSSSSMSCSSTSQRSTISNFRGRAKKGTGQSFAADLGTNISCSVDSGDLLASNMIDPSFGRVVDEGDEAFGVVDSLEAVETVTPVKKLEVGAGALVNQKVYDDPKSLKNYWEEKPAGMIYLNYCDLETMKKILDGGKKATKKDGFLNGVQVG